MRTPGMIMRLWRKRWRFSGLVREGKVRYIAASNFGARHIQKAADLSRFKGYMPFIALQGKYNLLVRSPEWEFLSACEENGWGFTVWVRSWEDSSADVTNGE